MGKKLPWTLIEPELHGFQYLKKTDVIYYHLEYFSSQGLANPNNSLVFNYKRDINYRNTPPWYYKMEAIEYFAKLIINTPFSNNRLLISAPTSKCRASRLFDSRNDDVLKRVNEETGIPISFNLDAIKDSNPTHFHSGYRAPANFQGLYSFIPFAKVPKTVYIVDDVITSGSHFVVWRDLIKNKHPSVEVRGIYLARAV